MSKNIFFLGYLLILGLAYRAISCRVRILKTILFYVFFRLDDGSLYIEKVY